MKLAASAVLAALTAVSATLAVPLRRDQRLVTAESDREPTRLHPLPGVLLQRDRGRSAEHRYAHDDGYAVRLDSNRTSTRPPRSKDYNEETELAGLPVTAETALAALYCALIASAPLILAGLAEDHLTRAHMLESVALVAWLGSALFLFTNVLDFQSLHWTGHRPVTIVEAVYLLSQILTTVGYGDITPASGTGQVIVGFMVIIALCLYGSIIMEVVEIIQRRVAKALARQEDARHDATKSLVNWDGRYTVDRTAAIKSVATFSTLATIGVLFWHYYPGEEKAWLDAIYFSIITLSTVGDGAFTATTEAGKVFGAFWMLLGVSSLAALVSTFIELMLKEKEREKFLLSDVEVEFQAILDRVAKKGDRIDKVTFLKFGLMLDKKLQERQSLRLHKRWEYLSNGGREKLLRRTLIIDKEGPEL